MIVNNKKQKRGKINKRVYVSLSSSSLSSIMHHVLCGGGGTVVVNGREELLLLAVMHNVTASGPRLGAFGDPTALCI